MYPRLSRLRSILYRIGCFSLIIFLFVEFRNYFHNDDKDRFVPITLNSRESSFWLKLIDQDRFVNENNRYDQIEFVVNEQQKSSIKNWTLIFDDLYQRKLMTLNERDKNNPYKSQLIHSDPFTLPKTFDIFEETPVFQRPKFCSAKRIFHPQCPFTNCRWTCSKSSSNDENIRRAHVFHHVDINRDEILSKLKTRRSNEIWILWIDEANRQLEELNSYQFNWTLSFRQDSEVSIGTYGLLINHQKQHHSINQSDNHQHNFPSEFIDIFLDREISLTNMKLEHRLFINYRYRTRHALWFVSNCDPKARLDYYEQLKDFFPIQTFGSCITNDQDPCEKNHPCERKYSYLAMFYLAFESQTCLDYITEKFWRALHYGMIPIVLGPKKQSYLDLGVPASAFIHVDDFSSAQQLGEYLHRISRDYFLYRQYFQWLNSFDVFYETNDLEPIRMCELCMRLNEQTSEEHRYYSDVHQWHRTGC